MSSPLPHIPEQFAKLAALAEGTTFPAERDTARRKAEALLPPEAGGFDRALRILAYLEREAARRAKGAHPGMTRLQDDELAALLDVLRREVGTTTMEAAR